jgi:hypothetical protein
MTTTTTTIPAIESDRIDVRCIGWVCAYVAPWRSWSLPCLPLMSDRSRSPGEEGDADQDSPGKQSYVYIYIYMLERCHLGHLIVTLPGLLISNHQRSKTISSNRTKHTRIVTFVMATNTFLNMASLSDKNISLYFIPIASRSAPDSLYYRSLASYWN